MATRPCCWQRAQHFAKHRNFDGTVYLIFQPAEEGGGGARVMIEDGLFEEFPMQAVLRHAQLARHACRHHGRQCGAGDGVHQRIQDHRARQGRPRSHAAHGVDPVPIACQMVQAFQTIISRNKKPVDAGVISVTMIPGRRATSVVPDFAALQGTVRTFSVEPLDMIERRMRQVAEHTCACADAVCDFAICTQLPAHHQHPGRSAVCPLGHGQHRAAKTRR